MNTEVRRVLKKEFMKKSRLPWKMRYVGHWRKLEIRRHLERMKFP